MCAPGYTYQHFCETEDASRSRANIKATNTGDSSGFNSWIQQTAVPLSMFRVEEPRHLSKANKGHTQVFLFDK